MNLTVLGPRVFIRPDKLPEVTESGLHIVHDRQHVTMTGTVVAVGDGPEFVKQAVSRAMHAAYEAGYTEVADPRDFEHVVSVGEKVLFSPDKGEELIFERDVLISMLEDDILAVVE